MGGTLIKEKQLTRFSFLSNLCFLLVLLLLRKQNGTILDTNRANILTPLQMLDKAAQGATK